eukprot:876340-Pleurochrysis_carterae.AAC.1
MEMVLFARERNRCAHACAHTDQWRVSSDESHAVSRRSLGASSSASSLRELLEGAAHVQAHGDVAHTTRRRVSACGRLLFQAPLAHAAGMT